MMDNYVRETSGPILTAIITCGSKVGYGGDTVFSLDDIAAAVDEINKERNQRQERTFGCIIEQGILVGRTGETDYRETVYKLAFSWSPRSKQIHSAEFLKAIEEYTDALGLQLQQERMYIEFQGERRVYKKKE